jgi:hypothetical protein
MSAFTGSMWSATVRLPLIYQGSTNYKVQSFLLKLGTFSHHRVFNQNGRSNYLQMCLLTLLYLQSSFHIHPPSYWYIFHMHQQEAIEFFEVCIWRTKPSFLRGWQYVGCCQRCHRSPHGTMRVPWKQQQIPVRHGKIGAPHLCSHCCHGLSKPESLLHWLRSVMDCKTLKTTLSDGLLQKSWATVAIFTSWGLLRT